MKRDSNVRVVVSWVVSSKPSPMYVRLWDRLLAEAGKEKVTSHPPNKVDHRDHDEEVT